MMQLYWSLKSIPELSGLSFGKRGSVWRTVQWKLYRHWQIWIALVGIALFAYIVSTLSSLIGYPRFGGIVGAGVGGFIYGQVAIRFARPYLRASLPEIQPR